MEMVKMFIIKSIKRTAEGIYALSVAGKKSVAEVRSTPPLLTILNISSSAFFLSGLRAVAEESFHSDLGKSYRCFVSSPEVPLESFWTLRKLHRMFRNPNRKSVKFYRTLTDTRRMFVEYNGKNEKQIIKINH